MKRCSSLTAVLLVLSTSLASADTHKVLVLQSEGRVDPGQRAKIDASILKLAKAIPGADASSGDTTMSDAAAAVGCKPDTQACRDEIMGMLSVDELVYATLTPKPGGTELEVHRISKTGTSDAKMMLAANSSPDKLDGIAPLFGGVAKAEPPPPPPPPPDGGNAITTTTKPVEPVTTTTTTTTTAPVGTTPTASVVSQPPPGPGPAPGPSDEGQGHKRLELAGMIGGGALVLIGFMCWGSANDLQSQIDQAPTQTKPQIDALVTLESRGDSYAAWGNALFIGGVVLGGVSTYFFIRDRRAHRHATSAQITPTVFDHGAGLALSFGGSR